MQAESKFFTAGVNDRLMRSVAQGLPEWRDPVDLAGVNHGQIIADRHLNQAKIGTVCVLGHEFRVNTDVIDVSQSLTELVELFVGADVVVVHGSQPSRATVGVDRWAGGASPVLEIPQQRRTGTPYPTFAPPPQAVDDVANHPWPCRVAALGSQPFPNAGHLNRPWDAKPVDFAQVAVRLSNTIGMKYD
jgi:hypothetical protein